MKKRSLVDEASNPGTPFQRLLQLSESEDAEVRRGLVNNPSIAVDEDGEVTNKILLKLAEEFPDEVVGCSAFALFGLELKEEVLVNVVNAIAEKAKDPGVLTLFFHQFVPGYTDVRWRIAWNQNTPPEVLRFMSDMNDEPEWDIREGVAQNPNTPLDVLRFMADKTNERDAYVRIGVAMNPKTPVDVLRFMADKDNEPNEPVLSAAIQALKDRGLQ